MIDEQKLMRCQRGKLRNFFSQVLGASKAEERDVVIVGGGISGLYCAKRIIEQKKPEDRIKRITILERSDRWGGRLDTDIIETGAEAGARTQIKEEEGAMRFTYDDPDSGSNIKKSNMHLLSRLIKDLGMEDQVKPFYMAPQRIPPNPDEKLPNNCNARFYNGQHFTDWYANQNPTMWKNLFNLERQEEFKSASQLVKDIYRKLLDHNKSNLYAHFQEEMADVIIAQEDIDLLQEYENAEYWTFFRNKFTWNVGMHEFPLNEFSIQALLTAMGYSHQCCMMMVQAQGFLFVSLSEGNVGAILHELICLSRLISYGTSFTSSRKDGLP